MKQRSSLRNGGRSHRLTPTPPTFERPRSFKAAGRRPNRPGAITPQTNPRKYPRRTSIRRAEPPNRSLTRAAARFSEMAPIHFRDKSVTIKLKFGTIYLRVTGGHPMIRKSTRRRRRSRNIDDFSRSSNRHGASERHDRGDEPIGRSLKIDRHSGRRRTAIHASSIETSPCRRPRRSP